MKSPLEVHQCQGSKDSTQEHVNEGHSVRAGRAIDIVGEETTKRNHKEKALEKQLYVEMPRVICMVAVEAVVEEVEGPDGGGCSHEEKLEVQLAVDSEEDGEQNLEDRLTDGVVSVGGTDEGPLEGVLTIEEEAEQKILAEHCEEHPRCQYAK
jgi:hypothetical protein